MRYVNNYANGVAAGTYRKFEDIEQMPVGSVLAKDSFFVTSDGSIRGGPLFLMEKMRDGFASDRGNWKYTMIMPDGSIVGTTKGEGSASVEFCHDCHVGFEDQDYMMLIPEEYRK